MVKYFVTGNNDKYSEIVVYVPDLKQFKINDLPEVQSLSIEEIIRVKIEYVVENLNYRSDILILEDTGLYLKALNNFPGPLIKFMLESIGNDGIYKICNCFDNYDAYATTVFGIYHPDQNEIKYYSGTVNGKITEPIGDIGFGWDRIFSPVGAGKSFAEMQTVEEKNTHSMRSIALQKMLHTLEEM